MLKETLRSMIQQEITAVQNELKVLKEGNLDDRPISVLSQIVLGRSYIFLGKFIINDPDAKVIAKYVSKSGEKYQFKIIESPHTSNINKIVALTPKQVTSIINKDGIYTTKELGINEGPEEHLGAFRRLVITSDKIPQIKAAFNTFMNRPETKASFSNVKMTVIDSPKPNTIVVDVNGDLATVVGVKLGDILKRTDSNAQLIIRKEKKLK